MRGIFQLFQPAIFFRHNGQIEVAIGCFAPQILIAGAGNSRTRCQRIDFKQAITICAFKLWK